MALGLQISLNRGDFMGLSAKLIIVFLLLWTVPGFTQTKGAAALQMRLTHTLYQGIFSFYFESNVGNQNLQYHANKSYLKTFLYNWSTMLASGKYQSTKEIFEEISRGSTYLGKHYSKWFGLHDFASPYGRIDLGGSRNQMIGIIYKSESQYPDLEQRIRYILSATNTYLVTSDRDYALSELIAKSFLNSRDPEIRKEAEGVMAAIPFQEDVVKPIINTAYSLVLVRIGLGFVKVPQALTSLPSALTSRLVTMVNPIFSKMTFMHWSLVGSAGLHVGGVGAGAGVLFLQDKLEEKAKMGLYFPPAISIGELWQAFNVKYPESFRLWSTQDFTPKFVPQTEKQLVAKIKSHFEQNTPIDYGDSFLIAEKLLKIDKRSSDDLLAADFVQNRYEQLKIQVQKIFGNGAITIEQIEQFRELVIKDALYSYRVEVPNLFGTLLDWGGNCVSQAMLMTALLEPYNDRMPDGHRLVVADWSDHIEAGLWNGKELIVLVQGNISSRITATVHKPEFMLVRLLRNFSHDVKKLPETIVAKPTPIQKKPQLKLKAPVKKDSEGFWSWFDNTFNREGALEKRESEDLAAGTGSANEGEGEGRAPRDGTTEYDTLTKDSGNRGGSSGGGGSIFGSGGGGGGSIFGSGGGGGGSIFGSGGGGSGLGGLGGLFKGSKSNPSDDKTGKTDKADKADKPSSGKLNFSGIKPGEIVGSIVDRLSGKQYDSEDKSNSEPPKPIVPPKPKFTISINFQPQKHLFRTFKYNSSEKNLTVFTEEAYEEFVAHRQQPDMDNATFEKFISLKQWENLNRSIQTATFKKIYVKPNSAPSFASSLEAMLQIADADFDTLDKELEEFKVLYGEKFGTFLDSQLNFDKLLAQFTESSKADVAGIDLVTQDLKVIKEGEIRFIKNILQDPHSFLEMYNDGDTKLRNHVLIRSFGTSFWNYSGTAEGSKKNLSLAAKRKVREYLTTLSEVKVDFSRESTFICNKVKVNLPRIPEHLVVYQFAQTGCQKEFKERKERVPLPPSKVQTTEESQSQTNVIVLKVSTLIELTVGFGQGLSIWTPEVVDAFINGYYQEIGPDRKTSIAVIKAIYESDRAYFDNPKYQPLAALWP